MTSQLVVVKVGFDPEAGVWFIENSSFPGLAGESATFEELAKRVPDMLLDLMEESGTIKEGSEVPCRDHRITWCRRPSRRSEGRVNHFGKAVRDKLAAEGCTFQRRGRGDHDIWYSPIAKRSITVDHVIKSRHTRQRNFKASGHRQSLLSRAPSLALCAGQARA